MMMDISIQKQHFETYVSSILQNQEDNFVDLANDDHNGSNDNEGSIEAS